jgi:hypothetical protein
MQGLGTVVESRRAACLVRRPPGRSAFEVPAMREWYESPAAKWVIAVCCIACIAFAGWRALALWRGPAPAQLDPKAASPPIRLGRPHGASEVDAATP